MQDLSSHQPNFKVILIAMQPMASKSRLFDELRILNDKLSMFAS